MREDRQSQRAVYLFRNRRDTGQNKTEEGILGYIHVVPTTVIMSFYE